MARPLKILFLMEDLCYGGTQKQSLALALRLDRKKFAPGILVLTGQTDLDGHVGDVPLHHMGHGRGVAPFFFIRLGAWLRRLAPDVVIPCTALPNIWGRIWSRAVGVPLVVGTCRGGGAPARQHEWLLWRLADGIVCNSAQLVEAMAGRGVPRSRLRYIANGVDTERFSPGPRDGQLILNVARLAADKDQKTLLAAFGRIGAEFPRARLKIVGEGPEEKALREFCATRLEPGIAARVEFAGSSHDPAPLYAAADIFALSSIREGQPNVILEAMSAGLPVCATAVGGIPDLVTDNGLLSAPGESGALAANLRALLASAQARRRMGELGRARVCAGFSFEAMSAGHEDFILQLWEEKQC